MTDEQTEIEPDIVVIPGGEFFMGCETGAAGERPVHRVRVDSFGLGRYTVTNGEYSRFVKAVGGQAPRGSVSAGLDHPEQPVTSVSWFDVTRYCDWLAERTGKPYRLPTEAEWERAARGGLEGRLYTWGDDSPDRQPRYGELWLAGPERVGLRPPNGYGLYDISENVHEWCSDWYADDYYAVSPLCNPKGPAAGKRRASRGGSWRHQVKITRVAARSRLAPEFRYSDYGFRCALSLGEVTSDK